MDWRRLDLDRIQQALRLLGSADSGEDLSSLLHEEPITLDMLRRLFEGYRYVDWLLDQRIDIFQYGASQHILELNHLVLCGTTPKRRLEFANHIAQTERGFYERAGANVGVLIDWYKRNIRTKPVHLAAGAFLRIVSAPQLFIEGNGRTASLLVSYLLAREGAGPLVVTEASFREYVNAVNRCEAIDRRSFGSLFSLEFAQRHIEHFLETACDPGFLLGLERQERSS